MTMIKAKRGFDFFTFWVEGFFVILFILGIVIASMIQSAVLSYIIAFLSGLLFGKLIYHKKKDAFAHYALLTIGFVIGYTIGNGVGSRMLTLLLFFMGVFVSFYAHEKEIF